MSLRTLTTADLRREIARRESGVGRLLAKHKRLSARLAKIDAELAALGVAAPGGGGRTPGRRGPGRPKGSKSGKRARNAMTLLEAILKGVRAGSTVSPAQAAKAAKAAGYKSSSPHFGMMVANTLAKSGSFKRLGRGQYQLKSGGRAASAKPARRGRPARKARRKTAAKAGRKKVESTPVPAAAAAAS